METRRFLHLRRMAQPGELDQRGVRDQLRRLFAQLRVVADPALTAGGAISLPMAVVSAVPIIKVVGVCRS